MYGLRIARVVFICCALSACAAEQVEDAALPRGAPGAAAPAPQTAVVPPPRPETPDPAVAKRPGLTVDDPAAICRRYAPLRADAGAAATPPASVAVFDMPERKADCVIVEYADGPFAVATFRPLGDGAALRAKRRPVPGKPTVVETAVMVHALSPLARLDRRVAVDRVQGGLMPAKVGAALLYRITDLDRAQVEQRSFQFVDALDAPEGALLLAVGERRQVAGLGAAARQPSWYVYDPASGLTVADGRAADGAAGGLVAVSADVPLRVRVVAGGTVVRTFGAEVWTRMAERLSAASAG